MSRAVPRPGTAARRRRGGSRGGKIAGRIARGVLVVGVFGVLLFAGIVAGIIASYSRNLPDINRVADYQPSRSTRVFARNGAMLANLYRRAGQLAVVRTAFSRQLSRSIARGGAGSPKRRAALAAALARVEAAHTESELVAAVASAQPGA